MDDGYSPEQLKAIEMCRAFLKEHEHFEWHIGHSSFDDYNILWGHRCTIDWAEACLKRDYSKYKGTWEHDYLQYCMDTFRNEYEMSEEEIDKELEALKQASIEILTFLGYMDNDDEKP